MVSSMKKALFLVSIFFIFFLGLLGCMYVGAWLFIEGNQWLKSSDVHYDWWHFIFFWDNAFCWLWYVNRSLWMVIAIIYSGVFAFIGAVVCVVRS